MQKDYSTYKFTDFLTDDLFVKTMLFPTEESSEFWSALIDAEKIDVNEFILANVTLQSLHENVPEINDNRIDALWNRISQTNKNHDKHKKQPVFHYFGVAAACVIIVMTSISLSFLFFGNRDNQQKSLAEFAKKQIIYNQDTSNVIKLIADDQKVEVEGNEASVSLNSNGELKVNNKKVLSEKKKNILNKKASFLQLRVPFGKRATLLLPDGSLLWVNAGTTVVYPEIFDNHIREIFVEGEVFAEVKKDKNRPFTIKTEKFDVLVLGTSFNISAYKNDEHKKVVLVSGLVNIKLPNGGNTQIKPNQLYTYSDSESSIDNVDVESYISWRDGVYIFRDEPVENILLRLSRYYNVTMILPNEPSGTICSGKLELKDDLSQILNGLSQITQISYAVKGNEFRIKYND